MTPNKQVSPVIRISQGERDASARATHLEAATRKFLVTTNERKQMSTMTNFKRIALVAVAALGLGVLSSVPSTAAVSGVTFTITNGATPLRGTATDTVNSDTGTGTGASINITALMSNAADSMTVRFFNKNTLSTQSRALLALVETTTSINTAVDFGLTDTSLSAVNRVNAAAVDSAVAGTGGFTMVASSDRTFNNRVSSSIGATFALFLDTTSTVAGAGTYTYTVLATTYNYGVGAATITEYSQDVSIVVSAPTSATTVPSAATTTFIMNSATGQTTESVVNPALATASVTPVAYFLPAIKNVSSNSATDTVTATVTGPGVLNYTGTSATGKSFSVAQTGSVEWNLRPDGGTGKSTITFSLARTGQTFTRTVEFYSAKAATISASVATPIMKVGSNAAALSVTVAVADTSTCDATGKPVPPVAVIFTVPPTEGIYTT